MYWPCLIDLTPNGKTLVCINRNMNHDGESLIEVFIRLMGKPEHMGVIRETRDIFLLFPHQNLDERLRPLALHLSKESLLSYLDNQSFHESHS